MCVIERHYLIHPNGAPERKDHLRYCQFGSPFTCCDNTRIESLPDVRVPWPEPALGPPYQAERIEPREVPRPSRQEERRRSKKVSDGFKLVWDFHIPFTSKKSDKKKKRPTPRNVFVRRRGSQQRHEIQNQMPPEYHVPPPGYGPPQQGGPQVVPIPHGPQQYAPRAAEPQVIRPRRDHPLNVRIHQAGDSSSPSPPTPLRQHQRHHTRTPSETRRYEELKRQVRERERRDHVERQRRDQAERDAHEADEARQREIEHLRRENIELLRAERRRLEQEERQRNREQERRRMEVQDEERRQRRIRRDEQRRLESEQQERRRRQQEDDETEQARQRQERADRQALQEAAARDRIRRDQQRRDRRDQMRRDQAERDRIERQRRADIPRGPRHRAEVHHRRGASFEERGDQVIDEAIHRRQFEYGAPTQPRRRGSRYRDIGGGVRHDRIVYEDDRRRGGRRHR